VSQWTLRKCAAAGLDIIATNHKGAILPHLLPALQAMLSSSEWLVKESAVLAIGAVAEGCLDGIQEYLPQLLHFLLQLLNDPKPLVRSITCWTLSRYSKWIVFGANAATFFEPCLEGFLKRILDSNKKVQEAACSAFATLEEEAQNNLVPYLNPILRQLMFAFSKYQVQYW
jgi:transportin-1